MRFVPSRRDITLFVLFISFLTLPVHAASGSLITPFRIASNAIAPENNSTTNYGNFTSREQFNFTTITAIRNGLTTTTVKPANWPAWRKHIEKISTPGRGCFAVTYPDTVWQPSKCVTAPSIPLQTSSKSPLPFNVGNGYDEVAQSPTALIGSAVGAFQSINGLTAVSDTGGSLAGFGANEFSLQVNSQFFPGVSTTYTNFKSGYSHSWEQFVYLSYVPGTVQVQGCSLSGCIYIQYWLIGYQSQYGTCPSTSPPGGTSWIVYQGNCYANSQALNVPAGTASNLSNLVLKGYANVTNSNDGVVFCVTGGSCYTVAVTDQVLNLNQYWKDAEFNVFGFCCGSQATFNSGTTITVTNTLEDQSGNPLVPSCVTTGYTGETNNLNLGSCSSNSNGQIVFSESNSPPTTTTTTQTSTVNTSTTTTSTSTFQTATTTTTTSTNTVTSGESCTATATTSATSTVIQPPSTTTTTTSTLTSTTLTTSSLTSTSVSTTVTTTTLSVCTQTQTSTSAVTTLTTFTRPTTSISLQSSTGTLILGNSASLSGSISPNPGAVQVTISLSRDGGTTWIAFMTILTDGTGAYSTNWTPPNSGGYLLEATWNGNGQYAGSTSTTTSLSATGSSPSPTVLLSTPSSAAQGQTIDLSVRVFNPTASELTTDVTIQIRGPNSYTVFETIQTNAGANSFSTVYYDWTIPNQSGTYSVTVELLPNEPSAIDTATVQVA